VPDAPAFDTPPATPDAPPVLLDGPLGGTTYAYIVSAGDVPEVTSDGFAVGFDLDGRISDGTGPDCIDALDFTSPISGDPGVDDQLASNLVPLFAGELPEGIAGAFRDAIASGQTLLVLEVNGVDGFVNDPLVSVHVFYAETESGALPMVDASGQLVPGQSFRVADDLGTSAGAISGGRLRTTIPMLALRLAFGGAPIAVPIVGLRYEADISATALTNGEAGGRVEVAPVVAVLVAAGLPVDEPLVRAVAQPDLDLDAAGECASISAGLTLEAVEAVVVP
jgi:hypothetical protein